MQGGHAGPGLQAAVRSRWHRSGVLLCTVPAVDASTGSNLSSLCKFKGLVLRVLQPPVKNTRVVLVLAVCMWQIDRAQQSIIAPLTARLQLLLPGRHLFLAGASSYGSSAAHVPSPHSLASPALQKAGPLSMSSCAKALGRTQAIEKDTVGQLRAVQALQTAGSTLAAGICGLRWQNISMKARSVLDSTLRCLRIRLWA